MSDGKMGDLVDTKVCVKCGGEKTSKRLDRVGALWKENSRQVQTLQTSVGYTKQSKLYSFGGKLRKSEDNIYSQ